MSAKKGKKKCFIARDFGGTFIYAKEPHPNKLDGKLFWGNVHVIATSNVSPQLQKMWKLALKGLRGKAAIAEVDGETWIPYIDCRCSHCHGKGLVLSQTTGTTRDCPLCKSTCKGTRLMTAEYLK